MARKTMSTNLGRVAGLLWLLTTLSGCIVIQTTDTSGQAITAAARGQTVLVHLAYGADDADLVGFQFRLAYDPATFEDPTCAGALETHNFFSRGTPANDGAVRFIPILSFGTTLDPVPKSTKLAVCTFHVRSSAPTGSTTLTTYLSRGSAAPPSPGSVGALRNLADQSKTITIS